MCSGLQVGFEVGWTSSVEHMPATCISVRITDPVFIHRDLPFSEAAQWIGKQVGAVYHGSGLEALKYIQFPALQAPFFASQKQAFF
jgi:hypothetical protein